MDEKEALIAIVGMMVAFAGPLLLVAIILYYKHRKNLLTHETISRLAEKGLPVPSELLEPPSRGYTGLRAGLVLVALGIALAFFFAGRGLGWAVGLIPGLMGVALLASWAIERRARR